MDSKGLDEGGEGETSFPTVVLSAEELRIACEIHEGVCADEKDGESAEPGAEGSLEILGLSRRPRTSSFVEESKGES